MKIKPLAHKIICEKLDGEERVTNFGIIVANKEEVDSFTRGRVLAIGDGVTCVKVGDILILNAYQFTEYEYLDNGTMAKVLFASDYDLNAIEEA